MVLRCAASGAFRLTAMGCGLAVLSACASVKLHPSAPFPDDVRVEHLDPGLAFRILRSSPRQYQIVPGRLRSDSLAEAYRDETPVDSWDLAAGAADVWDEASTEAYQGNYGRAVDLYAALVEMVPRCSDCRVELARALLGMAARPGRSTESAEGLRRVAADHLLIASALRPEIPMGRGMYVPPDRLGRTNIPLEPKAEAARALFSSADEAYNEGNVFAARRAYLQVLREEPSFGRGYVAMGDTYYDESAYEDAAVWYVQALRADSTDYLAWRSLAECYEVLGQAYAARSAAIRGILYNYQDAGSWEILAQIAAAEGHSVSRRRLDKRVEMREGVDGTVYIMVDSTLKGPAQTAWLGYGFIRAVWRYEGRFAARHPEAQRYHPTFDEEMEATATLVAVWTNSLTDTLRRYTATDQDLHRLRRIAEAGYLAEYVIYEELSADNPDLVTGLPPSALARLREYIEQFVITGLAL